MNLKSRNLVAAILVIVIAAIGAGAQKPTRSVALRPFEPAEELVYEAEISRGILKKLDVAELRLKAQRTSGRGPRAQGNGAPETLVLTCDVASKGFFPRLFGIRFRETLESTIDPASFAVQTSKRIDEHGKRMRTSEAVTPMPGLVVPFITFTLLYILLAVVTVWLLLRQVAASPKGVEADQKEVRVAA